MYHIDIRGYVYFTRDPNMKYGLLGLVLGLGLGLGFILYCRIWRNVWVVPLARLSYALVRLNCNKLVIPYMCPQPSYRGYSLKSEPHWPSVLFRNVATVRW